MIEARWRDDPHKHCSHCGKWLPFAAFPRNPRLKSGKSSWCQECHLAGTREWREANPDYFVAYNADRRAKYAAERGSLKRECANPECGREFVARRRDHRTCSQKCRDRLSYLRRREHLKASA
jgi:predicted nucleic acid-binding Zn ribbon protein